jgi:hypothetical protein
MTSISHMIRSTTALLFLASASFAMAQDTPGIRTTSPATSTATAPATPATPVPETGQAPIRVVLSYSDQKLKQIDVAGGCIICAVQGVAEAMAANGLGPETHAIMIVTVTPRYERFAQGVYSARLSVGNPNMQIDSRIDVKAQQKLRAEASGLLVKLRTWDHHMTETEVRALFGYDGKVDIPLQSPFAHIATWSHAVPTVSLKLEAPRKPRPILNYVTLNADGSSETLYQLPVGQAFWVEARYISLPDAKSFTADLAWGDGSIQIPLQATDRLLVFRSGPYYVAPPAPAAGGSD